MLPETTIQQAYERVEEIRKTIEEWNSWFLPMLHLFEQP
jgi:hypothetical protein